ncbi:MAG: MAPEG family protein [Cyanobacteria bacterium J06636_16]
MQPIIPVTTAFYAGVLGILGVALTIYVIVQRVQLKVEFGDGDQPRMAQAIRAHANFAEHVPIALLLLAFTEILGAAAWVVNSLGVGLIIARLLSARGLTRTLGPSFERQSGASLTIVVIAIASAYIIFKALT